ncbi:ABC transporter ATP-binding protein [Thalassobacillus hwangdonensis]|uniref:ABC transporter ATP-binding protein n=1 Tax=Thalassobacillus hwangdonensis TaxID=546108 RepID=A0ABW3L3K3_9BACI
MRKILAYVNTYKVSLWIGLSLMIVELIVELAQPLIMAKIIDDGILENDFDAVAIWGGILLGMSLLAFASGVINSFFSANVSQGVGYDLRRDLFKRVQAFTSENFQAFSVPSLLTRVTNDVTQIQNLIFMSMRIALRAPLFIIGGLIMAFTVHVGLAMVLLFTVPFILLFLSWVLLKGVVFFRKVQEKLDGVNTVIRENLANIRLIKGFHRGNYEEKRFTDKNVSLRQDNKKALWLMELAMPIVMVLMNAVILLLLWLGAGELRVDGAQPGEVVAIINYATRMLFTFSVFTFLIMTFSRGKASATRIFDVLETEAVAFNKEASRPELKGGVQFKGVSFDYPEKEATALKQVSFTVEPGQTIGLLGETGAGKTTLLHLIPRLLMHKEGSIVMDGTPIEAIDIEHLRNGISLVPQDVHLFSGTISENIRWGKQDATDEEVIQAAKDAQIHHFVKSLPEGYQTRLGQKGVTFSGGQKQRLSIARALIRKPKLLILDDSTSALDAHTETKLLKTLKQHRCTVFIVAQKISTLREADQILLLHKGELVASGTHEELLETSAEYNGIYQSQQRERVMGNG